MDSKTVKNSNAETLDKSALSVRGGVLTRFRSTFSGNFAWCDAGGCGG